MSKTGATLQDEYRAREAKREKSFIQKCDTHQHRIRELELEIASSQDLVDSFRFVIEQTERMGMKHYKPGLNIAIGVLHNRLERLESEKAKTSASLGRLVGGR